MPSSFARTAKTVAPKELNYSPLAPEPTWDEWHRFRDEYNNDAMTWFRAHGIGAPEQLQDQIQMVEFGAEEWMKKRWQQEVVLMWVWVNTEPPPVGERRLAKYLHRAAIEFTPFLEMQVYHPNFQAKMARHCLAEIAALLNALASDNFKVKEKEGSRWPHSRRSNADVAAGRSGIQPQSRLDALPCGLRGNRQRMSDRGKKFPNDYKCASCGDPIPLVGDYSCGTCGYTWCYTCFLDYCPCYARRTKSGSRAPTDDGVQPVDLDSFAKTPGKRQRPPK